MVLFNYSTKELTAKVVYYGPGLGGKTTNLQWIHEKVPIKNKGKMLSLATETDRTLFFDFLPIEIGTIRTMRTRIQLYTVPGQVFYNATRRMVLKGADAIVFVSDSQEPMLDANLESFENMRQNLEANEIAITEIPIVFQFNKRDLPNALPIEILNERLNLAGHPFNEAIAVRGIGVEETLKSVTKLVFKSLSTKYGDTPTGPSGARPPVSSARLDSRKSSSPLSHMMENADELLGSLDSTPPLPLELSSPSGRIDTQPRRDTGSHRAALPLPGRAPAPPSLSNPRPSDDLEIDNLSDELPDVDIDEVTSPVPARKPPPIPPPPKDGRSTLVAGPERADDIRRKIAVPPLRAAVEMDVDLDALDSDARGLEPSGDDDVLEGSPFDDDALGNLDRLVDDLVLPGTAPAPPSPPQRSAPQQRPMPPQRPTPPPPIPSRALPNDLDVFDETEDTEPPIPPRLPSRAVSVELDLDSLGASVSTPSQPPAELVIPVEVAIPPGATRLTLRIVLNLKRK